MLPLWCVVVYVDVSACFAVRPGELREAWRQTSVRKWPHRGVDFFQGASRKDCVCCCSVAGQWVQKVCSVCGMGGQAPLLLTAGCVE